MIHIYKGEPLTVDQIESEEWECVRDHVARWRAGDSLYDQDVKEVAGLVVACWEQLAAIRLQDVPCPRCEQVAHGQTGDYPCEVCGLPTLLDAVMP